MNKKSSVVIILLLFISWLTLGYGWMSVVFITHDIFSIESGYEEKAIIHNMPFLEPVKKKEPILVWILESEVYIPMKAVHRFRRELNAQTSKGYIDFYEYRTKIEELDKKTGTVKLIDDYKAAPVSNGYGERPKFNLREGWYKISTMFVLKIPSRCIDSEGQRKKAAELVSRLTHNDNNLITVYPETIILVDPFFYNLASIKLRGNTTISFKDMDPNWPQQVENFVNQLPDCKN